MAVTDRDYMKEADETKPSGFMAKLNEFGEKHAKVIIVVSTAVIIIAVLIVADSFWRKSRFERGLQELDVSVTAEELSALAEKYKDDDVLMPRILYKLGNTYQSEAARNTTGPEKSVTLLENAIKTYEDFREKFKSDALWRQVSQAYDTALRNLAFLKEKREALLKAPTLISHPLRDNDQIDVIERNADAKKWVKDREILLRGGPTHEANPVILIELPGNKQVRIDLFEDEAPNTVANFIELIEKKYFDGLKFTKEKDKHLIVAAKSENPVTHLLETETTQREAKDGMLVMKKKDADSEGGRFFILLYEDEELKDHTIFGQVRDIGGGLQHLRTYKPEDAIVTIKIESKRDHEYKAVPKNP